MAKIYLILITICIQTIWAIYVVPEHTRNQVMDTLEMKQHPSDEHQTNSYQNPTSLWQQSKYLINSTAGTTADNIHSINAMHAKNNQLRHHTSYDKNDDVVVVAYSHNDENENNFENLEAQTNVAEERDGDSHTMHTRRRRQRRELSDWLIAPNTKWCGRGNTANGTYNHLGGASDADKCCRKHDHCKAFIPAMSNRYGLFNYRPYTLSHCSCDRRFRTCLKMANDEDAKTIGQLFFNMVQTQCFTITKERVCNLRSADGTCAQEHVKQKAYLRNNKRF